MQPADEDGEHDEFRLVSVFINWFYPLSDGEAAPYVKLIGKIRSNLVSGGGAYLVGERSQRHCGRHLKRNSSSAHGGTDTDTLESRAWLRQRRT